jgi:pimeloyl-ACP methyl ester carboxylesterase
MPFFSLGSLQLHYERTSAPDGRPALVLLHGMGSSSADWAWQVGAFAEQHRVLTVDLRAHGQSSDPGDWFTVERLAEDVAALLAHLEEPPAHLIGLSLGGATALALALRHPARARSLTSVNGFAKYLPASRGGVQRALRRTWLLLTAPMPVVAAYISSGLFPRPEQKIFYDAAVASLSKNHRRTYWAAMAAVLRYDARPLLPGLRLPTLILAGENDGTVALAAQKTLRQLIPGAQLLVIPHSGHATPYDQSEAFNRAVLEFVAKN